MSSPPRTRVVLVLVSSLVASWLGASWLGASVLETSATVTDHPERLVPEPPVGSDKAASVSALAVLARADTVETARLGALERWNLERRMPLQTGFLRPFENSAAVDFGRDKAGQPGVFTSVDGAMVWSARVEVERARRLRLHLSNVELSEGTRLWVRGEREVVAFDGSLVSPERELWTPSVGGGWIELIVALPHGSAPASEFRVDGVAEIFQLDESGAPVFEAGAGLAGKDDHCLEDGACYGTDDLPGYDILQEAVARLSFVDGGLVFSCTGTLINDTDPSSYVPYLQTANHCFSTQPVASSIEAHFDFVAESCNGSWPDIADLPRVNGATLLVTDIVTDSTLVELSANPPGITGYVGWSNAVLDNNETLYRLSHPFGWPQHFATYLSVGPFFPCTGASTFNYIYSEPTLGATAGGSSGSVLVDGATRFRGQLLGACGPDPEDICNRDNDDVDGRFARFFDQVSQFLAPGGEDDTAGETACVPGDLSLCLRDNRFQIAGTWRDFEGEEGDFHAVPYTDTSGLIWFFSDDNIEFLIKIINGCGFNGHYWVFFAATTDVEYTATVTDTVTGEVQTYTNPLGNASPAVTDIQAFATCP